ncbi:UMP kinase [Candidatus Poribacteria bacterium]|nr:UMP kinase [Candidatus Poribacteria bacterium]
MNNNPIYKRVVLELSGEMMRGNPSDKNLPISFDFLNDLSTELVELQNCGIELGVVVGGGNIWRGASVQEIEQTTSHQIGMLATVINALALQAALNKQGINSFIASAIDIKPMVELCSHHQVIKRLKQKEIVIFAGGTGQPFFTTDTGAALWALKIQADVILKATKVDGVYSSDPFVDKKAKKYTQISYKEAIQKELRVMDLTAFSLCKEYQLPIIVFKLTPPGNIKRIVFGENIGTIVSNA